MPWETSRRRKDPPYWKHLRQRVIDRAKGFCEAPQCYLPGNQVDHIKNLANGGTDSMDNLQLLCDWHHKRKTQAEAAEARKNNPPPSERRRREKHPGFVDD